jgi:hypothetical protein
MRGARTRKFHCQPGTLMLKIILDGCGLLHTEFLGMKLDV